MFSGNYFLLRPPLREEPSRIFLEKLFKWKLKSYSWAILVTSATSSKTILRIILGKSLKQSKNSG